MAIIGIIPARGGSKGFPGKNIHDLLGRPMIAYTIEAALAAETLDRVIVSTDSADIAEAARKWGAEAIMRPDEISSDTAPIEEALRHVVRTVEAEGIAVEIAVLMQANLPVRKPGLIDDIIRQMRNSDYDTLESGTQVNMRPEWMKKIVDGRPVPFMECASYRRQELPELIVFDGAVEAIRREALMGTEGRTGVHTYMGEKIGVVLQERIYAQDLDGADDLPLIEAALKHLEAERSTGFPKVKR